jgi:type IV secretory pathway VirB2 component (pilin)
VIIMGGFMKGKAAIFAVMGVVFIVLSFTMSSFTRSTFLIIGISWLVVAAFSFWMARSAEGPKDQDQTGSGWVG